MTSYAARGDVYKYGLPRGALGNPGRIVAASLAATDTIELTEHGFEDGDAVTLRATDGGTLSAPLVSGAVYYALRVTDSMFQVAATSGGAPIDLTTDGVSMMVSMDLPFDDVLEFYSRFVDGFLPAHVTPLPAPYPITVVAIVAELSAKKIQILSGMKSGSMDESEIAAGAQLKRWAAGLPVRDAAITTKPANVAVTNRIRGEGWIGRPLWGSPWPCSPPPCSPPPQVTPVDMLTYAGVVTKTSVLAANAATFFNSYDTGGISLTTPSPSSDGVSFRTGDAGRATETDFALLYDPSSPAILIENPVDGSLQSTLRWGPGSGGGDPNPVLPSGGKYTWTRTTVQTSSGPLTYWMNVT